MKTISLMFLLGVVFFTLFSCNSSDSVTLKKGDAVPRFELPDENNNLVNIDTYIGNQNLVIFFYPKDDTPGCTKEACKFRDEFEDFSAFNATVIGISSDSPDSHTEFKNKYNLPYTLLSDENNTVRNLFGIKGSYLGLIPGRVTYIIDKNGIIQHVFNSMGKAEKHVTEAKKVLKKLNAK